MCLSARLVRPHTHDQARTILSARGLTARHPRPRLQPFWSLFPKIRPKKTAEPSSPLSERPTSAAKGIMTAGKRHRRSHRATCPGLPCRPVCRAGHIRAPPLVAPAGENTEEAKLSELHAMGIRSGPPIEMLHEMAAESPSEGGESVEKVERQSLSAGSP